MTNDQLEDVLTDAFEGGFSAVWISSVTVSPWPESAEFASQCLTRGARAITIIEDCGDGTAPVTHELTLAKFKAGIRARAKQCNEPVDVWLDDYDAIEADAALQLAVLGEVRYG